MGDRIIDWGWSVVLLVLGAVGTLVSRWLSMIHKHEKQLILLEAEQATRKSLPPTDLKALLPLDQLRARLLTIKNRFTKGLEATAPITKNKRGMIKATAGGTALAIALTLIGLLGGALLGRLRKGRLTAVA